MRNGPNDRGTIKWTSLMLPEHVEVLQKLWKEDERVDKATLDEQQLEEIEFALQRAKSDDLPVEIIHHNGFDYSSTKVKVIGLDPERRKIRCLDIEEKMNTSLPFEDIFSVEFI
ncbi:YolD-like family protein [Halobacillus sp. B29]|uniref:YolD-like family protein n=1 Tax=Halobacillus sp. B29 TaxID=3457432 RepID=UPI003FCDD420